MRGRDSSIGIVSSYGLEAEVLGFNFLRDKYFSLQLSAWIWVPNSLLSSGYRGREAITHLPLLPRLRFLGPTTLPCRSRWPRDLRHELSSLARIVGSWVRIPLKARMSVCFYSVCVVLSVGSDLATD
jgi:hypothetical protein